MSFSGLSERNRDTSLDNYYSSNFEDESDIIGDGSDSCYASLRESFMILDDNLPSTSTSTKPKCVNIDFDDAVHNSLSSIKLNGSKSRNNGERHDDSCCSDSLEQPTDTRGYHQLNRQFSERSTAKKLNYHETEPMSYQRQNVNSYNMLELKQNEKGNIETCSTQNYDETNIPLPDSMNNAMCSYSKADQQKGAIPKRKSYSMARNKSHSPKPHGKHGNGRKAYSLQRNIGPNEQGDASSNVTSKKTKSYSLAKLSEKDRPTQHNPYVKGTQFRRKGSTAKGITGNVQIISRLSTLIAPQAKKAPPVPSSSEISADGENPGSVKDNRAYSLVRTKNQDASDALSVKSRSHTNHGNERKPNVLNRLSTIMGFQNRAFDPRPDGGNSNDVLSRGNESRVNELNNRGYSLVRVGNPDGTQDRDRSDNQIKRTREHTPNVFTRLSTMMGFTKTKTYNPDIDDSDEDDWIRNVPPPDNLPDMDITDGNECHDQVVGECSNQNTPSQITQTGNPRTDSLIRKRTDSTAKGITGKVTIINRLSSLLTSSHKTIHGKHERNVQNVGNLAEDPENLPHEYYILEKTNVTNARYQKGYSLARLHEENKSV